MSISRNAWICDAAVTFFCSLHGSDSSLVRFYRHLLKASCPYGLSTEDPVATESLRLILLVSSCLCVRISFRGYWGASIKFVTIFKLRSKTEEITKDILHQGPHIPALISRVIICNSLNIFERHKCLKSIEKWNRPTHFKSKTLFRKSPAIL
jgi:hypothetical protein